MSMPFGGPLESMNEEEDGSVAQMRAAEAPNWTTFHQDASS